MNVIPDRKRAATDSTVSRLPLGKRLAQINQTTLGIALVFVALAVMVTSFFLNLHILRQGVVVAADMLAENAGAPLVFNDRKVAVDLLRTLRHSPDMLGAGILDQEGRVFASYESTEHPVTELGRNGEEDVSFLGLERMRIVRPILQGGARLGAVELIVTLRTVYEQVLRQGIFTALAAICAIFLSRILLGRLNLSVLEPLDRLNDVMDRVSDEADYALRASPTTILELDTLAKGLNEMLAQIQARDDSLRLHREHLQDLVAERTAELEASRDAAERANAAKSEFLSRMSHELRTPLNAIIGFAELLAISDDTPLSLQQAENAREILHAGEHLLTLVNEVLDLARIESGRIDVSLNPVALAPVVNDCVGQLRPLAAQRNISIAANPDPHLVLKADEVRLKQVLLNLLSNAVKYNREGGSVRVDTVHAGTATSRVEVHDTGRGITSDKLPRLFKPFERLESSYDAIEGSGIGLALAKKLVEAMGGSIGVSSRADVGSTFWFELPIAGATRTMAGESKKLAGPQPTTRRVSSYKVLYIEDNPANLKLVRKMFATKAHLILLDAETAELGLEVAVRERPDLILLDINLPGMDGYEALERLREDPVTQSIPVIAVTANAMVRDVERGMAAGFFAYLAKPLDVSLFFETIDEGLRSVGHLKAGARR